ncbi:stomatin-4-like isoform X2 [Amphiura filiformis]|uniref:stomatin-4-like isoform X2 n=1 Tax=Amphiura filiformis TaxID=82378 RepID=UPI003B20F84E
MAEFVELQYTNDSVQSSPALLLPAASGRNSSSRGQSRMQTSRPSNKDFQRINQQEPDCKIGEEAPQQFYNCPEGDENLGCCVYLLMFISYLLVIVTFPVSLFTCLKVVQEYERAVISRMGRPLPGGARGPGIFFILPCIDNYVKVDLRTVSFDVPPQEVLSKDSVTVAVDAVVYYRVHNPTISITNVEDAQRSTRLLAATTLRNVLGTKTLGEMLTDRECISNQMQSALDEATDPWGVKVERVEIKDVRLPVQLQRAMAAEAEAAREARAKVIAAEGEQNASRALKRQQQASSVKHQQPFN